VRTRFDLRSSCSEAGDFAASVGGWIKKKIHTHTVIHTQISVGIKFKMT